MIAKQQFDILLDMVQIRLDDREYEQIFHQMGDIMGFLDTIKDVPSDSLTVADSSDMDHSLSLVDRDYTNQTIDLSGSHHPFINNMIQLRFKKN